MSRAKPKGILLAVPLMLTVLSVSPLLADSGANHQVKQTPPVKMGTSGGSGNDIGSAFCCGGTLGSLITRDGTLYVLSNNHILARSGGAVVGEHDIQPGLIDSACSATGDNVVGTFPGNLVPLGTANVDVGLSLADPAIVGTTGAILDIGLACTTTQNPTIGLAVTKSGRTTGQTFGTVQATNVNVKIQYQRKCNQGKKVSITYTNQASFANGTSSISAGGDSGSLIVSDDTAHRPVALLYAGSSSLTIGNPVADVVSALSAGGHAVSFVGQSCSAPPAASIWNPTSQRMSAPSEADVEMARIVKERHEPALFARPDILGAGVGRDDADSSKAVIVLYLETNAAQRPHGLPSELDGIKVKLVPTDPIVAQ